MDYNVDNSTASTDTCQARPLARFATMEQLQRIRPTLAAPRTSPRLAELVYAQMHRLIARGEYPQGCKLPPEGDLSSRFGVSRPVIRDALQRLKNEGYVRSQRGSGSVVVRGEVPGRRAFPPVRTIADLLRSYEYRIHVETATARLAAERRTQANLDELEQALEQAGEVLRSGELHLMADLNFAFHRGVARATQNAYYLATLELIPNFVGFDRIATATVDPAELAPRMAEVHDEHLSICAAIRERDPDRAAAEVARHIATARDRVLERQHFVLPEAPAAPDDAMTTLPKMGAAPVSTRRRR